MPNIAVEPLAGTRLAVVAGVIYNPERNRILIARRPAHLHLGGFWEFPGGKIQPGESPRAALTRELLEELAITVIDCAPLLAVSHDYADKAVLLDVWGVNQFSGVPAGNEGQEIAWVAIGDLHRYEFPAANQAVLARLMGA
jgi:8-oxo-dGTP diphosphatase